MESVSTKVRLPKKLFKKLKLKALKEDKSFGEVFRESLVKGMALMYGLPRRKPIKK